MAQKQYSGLRKFLFFLEFAAAYLFFLIVKSIPMKFSPRISRFIGSIMYGLDKRDREIAYKNLEVIYKDNPLTKEDQDRIIKKAAVNTIRMVIDSFHTGDINPGNYEKFVVIEGLENARKGLERGKGLLAVSLHIGNFEFLASVPSKLGFKVNAVQFRQVNPYSDIWLKNMREKNGTKSFYNEVSDLIGISRALRKGEIIALVTDQTHYRKPIFVPFFGKIAATADGPAKLHLRTGAPIMMCYSILNTDGRYILRYEEPVSFEKTTDEDADCKKIMTWINKEYEKIIIKNIEQWFSLFHNRWEFSKPEDFERFSNDIF